MNKTIVGIAICAVILVGLTGGSLASPSSPFFYHDLIWEDDFSGDKLDETKWYAMAGTGPEEGFPAFWGNAERQYYKPQNALLRDGNLVIRICAEKFEGMPYTSARITTSDLFSFTYGRVEARMKLPIDDVGLWPAMWLLPNGRPPNGSPADTSTEENDASPTWKYGGWAASGELDCMEFKSRLPGEISGAAHFGGMWPANTYAAGKYTFPEGQTAGDFHVYSLEWFPDKLIWFVDGQEYFRLEEWYTIFNNQMLGPPEPYDQLFCIILNVAVGGHFDGGLVPGEDFTEAEALVDWVRVYQ